jgi:hypothetical protein
MPSAAFATSWPRRIFIDDEAKSGSEPAPVNRIVGWLAYGNDRAGWKGFPAMLNALRRGGYTAKLASSH